MNYTILFWDKNPKHYKDAKTIPLYEVYKQLETSSCFDIVRAFKIFPSTNEYAHYEPFYFQIRHDKELDYKHGLFLELHTPSSNYWGWITVKRKWGNGFRALDYPYFFFTLEIVTVI